MSTGNKLPEPQRQKKQPMTDAVALILAHLLFERYISRGCPWLDRGEDAFTLIGLRARKKPNASIEYDRVLRALAENYVGFADLAWISDQPINPKTGKRMFRHQWRLGRSSDRAIILRRMVDNLLSALRDVIQGITDIPVRQKFQELETAAAAAVAELQRHIPEIPRELISLPKPRPPESDEEDPPAAAAVAR